MIDASSIFLAGFILIILGVALAFIATAIMIFRILRGRRVKGVRGGSLIMIGPIPIIFGTDKESMKTLILLSIILMAIVLIFMLISSWILMK